MNEQLISLVPRQPNAELATELRAMAEEADRGEFTRCIIVKLRPDHSFAVRAIGIGSDLAMAGALAFAQHDLITANKAL